MRHVAIALPPQEEASSRYTAAGAFRPGALAMVVGLHVAILAAVSTWQVVGIDAARDAPLIVNAMDLSEPPPPPPDPPPSAELRAAPPALVEPRIALPRVTPVERATMPVPPPPAPAPGPVEVDAPPAPAAPTVAEPPSPVAAGDISSSMIHAPPPRYPRESRRQREQGVVVLAVLLSADGRVAEIHVARSSGHNRLDTAARDAVRRWRWSPTLRGGAAVQVRGTVEIPFVLTG